MKTAGKAMAVLLTLAMLLDCMTGLAGADDPTGKYVSDVFIAYGKTEDEARSWLTNNGWEPIQGSGDFCAGKNSAWGSPIAAVMGIRRTGDPAQAVTDMAVMNMTGGYSVPEYEDLVKKKQAEIDEFIAAYMPAIREYRLNYAGKGSAFGKKRAEQAYALLNKFYDGDPAGPYAKADTGMKLGDLLLAELRQEKGENAYQALSAEQKKGCGDLQQIILESSGAAIVLLEQMLALAADTGTETWLERLSGLTGKDLAKNIGKYVPEAAGQNLAGSAVNILLRERFGDTARIIAGQWQDIRDELLWYEAYCDEYGLWPEDGESGGDYTKRVDASFARRRADNRLLPREKQLEEVRIDADYDRLLDTAILYENLYLADYRGEWGDTLGDFFNPYNQKNYGTDADSFLTFAAAMSPGQRASLEMVSLRAMLLIGFADEAGFERAKPDLTALFDGKDGGEPPLELSVYTGINRGIFRGGVALTSRAEMDRNEGKGRAFEEACSATGTLAVFSYVLAALGVTTFVAGTVAAVKLSYVTYPTEKAITAAENAFEKAQNTFRRAEISSEFGTITPEEFNAAKNAYEAAKTQYNNAINRETYHLGTAGKALMCIGAAIMIAAAFVKGYQLYEYYQRKFTPIPRMIVDESDIVTYTLDEDGNDVEHISFDQFEYYEAVRCNRQEAGELSDWQSGVSDYPGWGCGDVADLNGDFGQEWLALYTVKSPKKGSPILADSLVLQYGSSAAPAGCDGKLHKFTYTNAQDLGDTAYSYNNDKNGVYFFWASDPKAYATSGAASAFTRGQMAMSGAAGLAVGLLGTTLILYPRRKKEQEEKP